MPARYKNLVSAQVLTSHCDDPDWVILDCRFDFSDPTAGRRAFDSGHIPGAAYADLERDLSAPPGSSCGRHPLPEPDAIAQRFSRWGLNSDSQLVFYDANDASVAARGWWLARWLGHKHVAVLDGGMAAWQRAGLPLTTQRLQRDRGNFAANLRPNQVVDTAHLEDLLHGGALLLDARAAERFMGEVEPLDKRAGHIPGAHNHPYTANVDRRGHFLPAAELRLCYEAACCDHRPEELIVMCGSGVTACHNLLAMEIAGFSGARLYAGSWSAWSADQTHPVATGPDSG